MIDPLQVLLASVPVTLGSTTITEEDQLLGVGDVTVTDVVARLPPNQAKDTSGDATLNERMMLKSLLRTWVTIWGISNLLV